MNDPGRRWSVRLLIGGDLQDTVFVLGFRLQASRYERCDTATITLASAESRFVENILTRLTNAIRPGIAMQIRDLNDGGEVWNTIFEGMVDSVLKRLEPGAADLICRDYLALLMDRRLASSWGNRTSIEIVSDAVKASGLAFKADVESSDSLSGQFWQLEHRRLSATTQHQHQTAFDLAFSIARDHGCDCYVENRTVRLRIPVKQSDPDARIFRPETVLDCTMRCDLGLSRGVVVGVFSWDSRQRARSTLYYDGSEFSETPPDGDRLLYTFRTPGRRLEDIRRLAQGKYRRIVSHGFEVRASLPALAGLQPRHFISLDEPLIDRARILSVDAVHHAFDRKQGYRQDVVLRERLF